MSQYFDIAGDVVWNPCNGPGLLFVNIAKTLEPTAGVPTGIGVSKWGPSDPDCHGIDLAAFTAFTDVLARRYRASSHLILRSLIEGFLATAIVLVERGGGIVPALDGLTELAAEHASAMAW